MAKTRIQRIEDIEAQIQQLENQRKELAAEQKLADRKARDHRICKRGAHIESVLPEIIAFSDGQFKEFIKRTLQTEYARRELAKIKAQSVDTSPPDNTPIVETPPTPDTSETEQTTAKSQEK